MITVKGLKPGDIFEADPKIFAEYEEKPKLAKVEKIEPHFRAGQFFVTSWGTYRNKLTRYVTSVRGDAELELASGPTAEKLSDILWEHQVSNIGAQVVACLGYTVGADPEVFVEDDKGVLIPAFDFLPGKETPKTYDCRYGHGLASSTRQKLYWDGFQAEFTIAPQGCLAYMVDELRAGLLAVLTEARSFNKNAKLSSATVVEIPVKILSEAKSEHVELGCDPSANIYDMTGRPVPDGRALRMRFAGGHVHLGAGINDKAVEMVGAMDMLVGIPSVAMFEHWDSPVRRQYYGLPGEHRLPKHGLEYRVLSNAWLRHPALAHFTFDMCRIGGNFGFRGFHQLWKGDAAEVPRIIADGDVDAARKAIERNEGLFRNIITHKYNASEEQSLAFEAAYALMRDGAHKHLKAPDDMDANWKLTKGEWTGHSEGKDAQWSKASRDIVQGNKI